MNVLVLGGGGREHALAWKIKQSPLVSKVFISPGNPGTAEVGENVSIIGSIAQFCRAQSIELVVVGPDDLLAAGVVDELQAAGVPVFGSTKAAAQIEWSNAFAKQLMEEASIPTARSKTFTDYDSAVAYVKTETAPFVIKASGLALGKGVVIAQTEDDAVKALAECFIEKKFGDAGSEVVVEEFLVGVEFSVHAICAGTEAIMFPPAQDHKRIGEGDTGPNTGGMGTVAPVPVSKQEMEEIREKVVLPTLTALSLKGIPFSGLLFPGIMRTKEGFKVLEFNARFGDPETQSYMRLMKSDIVPVLLACAKGNLADVSIEWEKGAVASVVLASGGYPGAYEKGKEITGIENAEGTVIFHAGTVKQNGALFTNGGRVLNVTAYAGTLQDALAVAYAGASKISFEGIQYRKDLGQRLPGKKSLNDILDSFPERFFLPKGEKSYNQALVQDFATYGNFNYGPGILAFRELFHIAASSVYIGLASVLSSALNNPLLLWVLLGLLFVTITFKEFYHDPRHRSQLFYHGLSDWLAWVLPIGVFIAFQFLP